MIRETKDANLSAAEHERSPRCWAGHKKVPAVESAMLNIGDRIGDWEVERTIGEGGMGAVYKCKHAMSEKLRAAVKVLKPHDLGDARVRFMREVETLYSLRHPAIVRVTGWGDDAERGLLWMAMELVDGEELEDVLLTGRLDEAAVKSLFRQLADGLAHAHDKGIAHRDIKPPNIMITASNEARLLDFGIAVDNDNERLTSTGVMSGTLAYLPPEAFETETIDPMLGDVYSLGVVMYEALTGKLAFPTEPQMSGGQKMAVVMRSKIMLEELDPGDGFSDEVRQLIRKTTAQEPDERLPSMAHFAEALGGPVTGALVAPTGAVARLKSEKGGQAADPGSDTSSSGVRTAVKAGGLVVMAGGAGAAGVAAIGVIALVLAAVIGGVYLYTSQAPAPQTVASVQPTATVALPAPVAPPGDADETPPVPAKAAPVPSKSRSPTKSTSSSSTRAAPSRPTPTPSAGSSGPAKGKAHITIEGDAKTVLLIHNATSRKFTDSGDVLPGAYKVKVWYQNDPIPQTPTSLVVKRGESATITCSSKGKWCRKGSHEVQDLDTGG